MNRAARGALMFLVLVACRQRTDAPDDGGPTTTPILERADSLYAEGEFAAARDLWTAELRTARSSGDSVSVARLLTSIGLASKNLGDFTAARAAGEEGLALTRALRLDRDLFRAHNALGLLALLQGRLEEASTLFGQAARAAAAVGDSVGVAKATNNMGLVRTDQGELLLARDAFARLRDVSRAVADTVSLGRALVNLAMANLRLGDPLAAVAAVEEARRLARAAGDAEAEESALGQLADAYMELGEAERAFAAIDSAMVVAEAHGLRRQVAEDLKLRGDFYSAGGDHRRALVEYARAQVVNRELELRIDEGNTLRNEARSYRALGHPDSALARAERALALHRDGGFRPAELDDQLLLAELAVDRGDTSVAWRAIREAERIARTLALSQARARVSLGAARLEDRAGRPAAVLAALDAAPGLALVGDAERWEADALRARAHARLGNLDAAELAGRRAVTMVERVRSGFGSGPLRTSYLTQQLDVYADLVLVLLARGQPEEAFQVADAARGRALIEHLSAARRDIEAGGGPAADLLGGELLLRRIDALTSQLRRIDSVPPRSRGAGEEERTRSLETSLAEARSDYEALIARIAGGGPGAATLLGAPGMTARDVRQALRPGELLVQYFLTADDMHVFVLDTSGVRHVRVDVSRAGLSSRVRLARELLAEDRGSRVSEPVMQELHRILIGPVAATGAMAGIQRLVVVPHGALAYLPFAALIDEQGEPLVARVATLVLPSAAALPALRRRQADPPVGPAARAVALAPLPADLPASRKEVADVGARTGARQLMGARATERALREALATAPLVHVATHGTMNAANPMFTRIELAPGNNRLPSDDGRLEVHELLGLRVAASLVYLSGCETGRGAAWRTSFERGEDYATLAQAFLYAGASNVVATLWRIDDPAAAVLAGRYYEALLTADPVDALALAQRAMLRDPPYRGPYFWAAYGITGSGVSPSLASRTVSRR